MSSVGYPDYQRITQWLGAPLLQGVGVGVFPGPHVDGPLEVANYASVIVALKAIGGNATVTIKQTVPGGPGSLVLTETIIVPAGATVFESFVLFGQAVELDITGSIAGTTVDYALYGSNTTTNAQVITSATINIQRNDILVAAEPTLDFQDDPGFPWSVIDDGPGTRVKIKPPPGVTRTILVENAQVLANTVAPTDLTSGGIIIPAGAMGHNGWAKFSAAGQIQNATGAPQNLPKFQVGINGIVFNIDTGFGGLGVGIATAGTLFGWKLEVELQMHGAANVCVWTLDLDGSGQGSGAEISNLLTTGEGLYQLTAHGLWKALGFNYDVTTNYDTGARQIVCVVTNPVGAGYNVWCDRRRLEVCYEP